VLQVPTPLCRRPPVHEAALAAVLQLQLSLGQQITSTVGDGFTADDGPSALELQVGLISMVTCPAMQLV
jgi:hypothetical protein